MSLSIFSGQIIFGHGRGRKIGFPTLNLQLKLGENARGKCKNNAGEMQAPFAIASGVYAVKAQVNGVFFYGAMHLGPRPTFHEKDPTVELHLIGFSGEKVSGEVTVEVLKRLRGIRTFVSQEALKKQIEKDMMVVRKMMDEMSH